MMKKKLEKAIEESAEKNGYCKRTSKLSIEIYEGFSKFKEGFYSGVDFSNEKIKQLEEAYKDYVQCLTDDIISMAVIANHHGWKSRNVERGEKCREIIKNILEKQ